MTMYDNDDALSDSFTKLTALPILPLGLCTFGHLVIAIIVRAYKNCKECKVTNKQLSLICTDTSRNIQPTHTVVFYAPLTQYSTSIFIRA